MSYFHVNYDNPQYIGEDNPLYSSTNMGVLNTAHVEVSWVMGVPRFIIHVNRISPYKPSSYWGTSIDGNPHLYSMGIGQ